MSAYLPIEFSILDYMDVSEAEKWDVLTKIVEKDSKNALVLSD